MFNIASDTEAAKAQIERDLKAHPILLFMKGTRIEPRCGFSQRAAQMVGEITDSLSIPLETRDVLLDDALRRAIKEYSDWPTLPQLYVCGELIGGCDIITALFESGELEACIKSSVQ